VFERQRRSGRILTDRRFISIAPVMVRHDRRRSGASQPCVRGGQAFGLLAPPIAMRMAECAEPGRFIGVRLHFGQGDGRLCAYAVAERAKRVEVRRRVCQGTAHSWPAQQSAVNVAFQ
jgi:hypothetical protein